VGEESLCYFIFKKQIIKKERVGLVNKKAYDKNMVEIDYNY
jgi:hypothetical protein